MASVQGIWQMRGIDGELAMEGRPKDLPEYDNPPVNEVAISVEFVTDKPLRVVDIGLFWQNVREEFPKYEEQPPLGKIGVTDGLASPSQPSFEFRTGAPPLARCWFRNATGNRLIQVQKDRLVFNWIKSLDSDPYPRFEAVQGNFFSLWEGFSRFTQGQGLGQPAIKAAELTYINLIEQGQCWNDIKEIPKLFTFCHQEEVWKFLPDPEVFTYHLRFQVPQNNARLLVDLMPVLLPQKASRLAFRFSLSVQGAVDEKKIPDWFCVAREWIVKGFTDLTTERAHTYWRRTQ
jgi:uncharacterized protein (TIGR04255 family)